MSKHDDLLYLGHMLEYARWARTKVAAVSREQFDTDRDLQMLVAHLIQVVGEASRRVSEATRTAHPEIEWARIRGMRHKIVHDYVSVNVDVVWDTATQDLPELRRWRSSCRSIRRSARREY